MWLRTLKQRLTDLLADINRQQIETLLSGEADGNDCYIEVHSGAGGTESQDWASMLLRMYTRWAEKAGFKVEVLEVTAGEEAGIKAATIMVKGENAYGWSKTESGVHRLVRISPFDSQARRHTSFSSIWVYPVIDDSALILKSMRVIAGSIRIGRLARVDSMSTRQTQRFVSRTNQPELWCNVRTSARNTRTGRRLGTCSKPGLYERELQIREDKANAEAASKTDIGWGHQIRSYVLAALSVGQRLANGRGKHQPSRCAGWCA